MNNEITKQKNISLLANLPTHLSALSQADYIQKCCASVGFDWDNIDDVFDKIVEEVAEVKAELPQPQITKAKIEKTEGSLALKEEIGDLLFAVVNLCRHIQADPEVLLQNANKKFSKRFHGVETRVIKSGSGFAEHSLAELEVYWQQVKNNEKK